MKNLLRFITTIILPLILFYGCSLKKSPQTYKETRLLMGTYVSLTCISQKDPALVKTAIEKTFQKMENLEKQLSRNLPESEIYKINHRDKQSSFKLSAETFRVLQLSLKICSVSNGAFDITINPLLQYWKKAKAKDELPSQGNLFTLIKKKMGYQNIHLNPENKEIILKNPQTTLDLGGIAKGYIVDQGIKVLKEEGFSNIMIDAGGDIYTSGKNSTNIPWQIGIQDPKTSTNILQIINISNRGVATSGNYERFFTIKNKKYSHIINPKNGWPVNDILSVTIISPTCALSDGIATAVTVLGKKEGLALIEQFPEVEGMIISNMDKDSLDIITSSGFDRYISP